jgi:capsular polysaccharide transport system permease protein
MSISVARLKPSRAAAFAAWSRVLVALVVREGTSEYSNRTLGFFWVIGEPVTLICGVMALWSLAGRDAGHPGTPVIGLAISAYTIIQLWRRAVFPALGVIQANRWLFFHPTVHVLDIILASCLIESIAVFTAFMIVSTFCMLLGALDPIRDPGLVLAAWGLLTYWCFCFCIFIAGLALLNEFVEKWMHPLMYLTLPITGVFTMAAWVSPRYREILEWVALANCAEMFRAGMFSLSVKTYWSVPLIVIESTIFLVIGLPILNYARRKLQVGG